MKLHGFHVSKLLAYMYMSGTYIIYALNTIKPEMKKKIIHLIVWWIVKFDQRIVIYILQSVEKIYGQTCWRLFKENIEKHISKKKKWIIYF